MVRDPLWPVFARRATAAISRRSQPDTPALVDAPAPLPQPRLEEQLAVCLAGRLPSFLVALLGVRGLRALAWLLALPTRLIGRIAGVSPAGGER